MIVLLVGNRPQYIKLAPLILKLDALGLPYKIINSGQHYDKNLSDIFFEGLGIRHPDIKLQFSKSSDLPMISEIMLQLGKVLPTLNAKSLVVFGDTNTTLSGALAAAKLQIPIIHIEAGPRTGDKSPEETNRKIVDHISDLLFAPDEISLQNLKLENLVPKSIFSGDIMLDAFKYFGQGPLCDGDYSVFTFHRAINTDSRAPIANFLNIAMAWKSPIKFPLHPRTKAAFEREGLYEQLSAIRNLEILPPLGYVEMMKLVAGAKNIVTDSGGLQKEAYFAQKPCFVLENVTPWPNLRDAGYLKNLGKLANIDAEKAISITENFAYPLKMNSYFGDGNAAQIIIDTIIAKGFA